MRRKQARSPWTPSRIGLNWPESAAGAAGPRTEGYARVPWDDRMKLSVAHARKSDQVRRISSNQTLMVILVYPQYLPRNPAKERAPCLEKLLQR